MRGECDDRIVPDKSMYDMSLKELEAWLELINMCTPCAVCEADRKMVERHVAWVKEREKNKGSL